MVSKILLFLLLFLNFYVNSKEQDTAKAKFSHLEFAYYDLNSPRTKEKDKVELYSYTSIDENGFMKFQTKNYYGEVEYYTFQLSDSMIHLLSQIFNEHSSLQDYIKETALEYGAHFAGYYSYIGYTLSNNRREGLCFIDSYISKALNDLLDKLDHEISLQKKIKAEPFNIVDQALVERILSLHKKSKFLLPAVELAPPVGH